LENQEEFNAVMNNHQLKHPDWMEEWVRSTGLEQKSSIEMRELKDGWFSTFKVYEDDPDKMEQKLERFAQISTERKQSLNKMSGLNPE